MTRLLYRAALCAWGPHVEPAPAVMEREHPALGWLPACRHHLAASLHLPASFVGRCTVCGRTVRARKDGCWPRHRQQVTGPHGPTATGPWCPAEGRPVDGYDQPRQVA